MSESPLHQRIIELLRPESPERIYLFGSRARSMETEESDVDLVVVLPIDKAPESYSEKMEHVRRVRRLLGELNKQYPLDLLVFTRPEWERFRTERPLFAAEILGNGKKIA